MASHAKKSTKKFEKNHLKDTLGRRKEFAKIKQRNRLKDKKKARRAKDNEKASDNEPVESQKALGEKRRKSTNNDKLKEMTVDEFFQGGFEMAGPNKMLKVNKKKTALPKLGKRKRGPDAVDAGRESGSDSGVSVEENPVLDDSESGSEGEDSIGGHREDLEALAEKDPEFYKYLQENDTELLDFSENVDLAEVDKLSETEELLRRKKKITSVDDEDVDDEAESNESSTVMLPMVDKWENAMKKEYSLRSLRQVVLAFRAAAHTDEEGKEYKYTISTPEVYHKLLVVALKHIPDVLHHHLPVRESASGRVRVPTDSKKYRTLTPLLNTHTASITHLLETLSDASTLKLTLAAILPLLPYILSFKKVLKNLIKGIVDIWSDASSAEATRINAFLLIRRLAVISDASIREALLKATYQGLIKGSRSTTIHSLAGINLMKNSAVELWGLDPSLGYTTGFVYIRQLAIHLRTSITKPTKDSYKAVYNWQYTHSLDFWSRVLSTHCSPMATPTLGKPSDSPLHPLIYPLVQITLGALRLIPTPTYFPLRFHLTRSLLRISYSTNTYIPLAPALLEVLQSPEMKNTPKPSTLKPLDFSTSLRAPKSYSHTRTYQDGVGEQISELFAEFFGIWAKNIAFPELIIPPSVLLKRWLKDTSSAPNKARAKPNSGSKGKGNRNGKLISSISLLVQKLAANASFVEEKRRKVEYAVSDRKNVESFLRDVEWGDLPLGAYVEGLRKRKEERERLLEQGRREEEKKRATEKDNGEDDHDEVGDGAVDAESEDEDDVEMEEGSVDAEEIDEDEEEDSENGDDMDDD